MTQNQRVARAIINKISMGLAFLLTFFLGPFGVLYVSILGGILFILVAGVVSLVTFGWAVPFFWFVSIIWAMLAVRSHNERLIEDI